LARNLRGVEHAGGLWREYDACARCLVLLPLRTQIAALLTQRNIEEAAKAAGIGTRALLRWLKLPEFQETVPSGSPGRAAPARNVRRGDHICLRR
jgi:hypothetical protein